MLPPPSPSASDVPQHLPTTTPSALLLDLDGTLVDTEDLHFQSVVQVLADLGVAIDGSTYAPYFGWAEVPFWKDLQARLGLTATLPALVAARSRVFLELLHATSIEPLPGVLELLAWARSCGVPVAVASSSPREQIDASLLASGLAAAIPVRRSGHDDVAHGKPAADVYLAAAEALGVVATAAWALEDSPTGMAAAQAAGAFTIAVPDKSHPTRDFRHADLVCLGGIPELLRLISARKPA